MRILKKILLSVSMLGLFSLEVIAGKQSKDLGPEASSSKATHIKKTSPEANGKKRKYSKQRQLPQKKKKPPLPKTPSLPHSYLEKENVPPPIVNSQISGKRKRKKEPEATGDIKKKKQHLCQETSLKEHLRDLQQRIKEIHAEPERWEEMREIYQTFNKLDYPEEAWIAFATILQEEKDSSFCHFPNQTYKEAIGAYLFYPSFINNWVEHAETEHLLERFDVLWSFAAGAKLKDARSQYYLGRGLDFIWENYIGDRKNKEKPKYIRQLFKEAFLSLPGCKENADVCYIIGRTYYKDPHSLFSFPVLSTDRKKALEWFSKGGDLKSQYLALEIRSIYGIEPIPTKTDYINLGRQGHERTLFEASQMMEDSPEEQLAILKEGEKESQGFVFLDQGYIYEEMAKKHMRKKDETYLHYITKARECYKKAGELGLAQGYIELGKSYVDNIAFSWMDRRIQFETVSENDIKEAKKAFKQAGKMKDYEGWEYLTRLNNEIGDLIEKKQEALKEDKTLTMIDKRKQRNTYEDQKNYYYKKGKKASRKAHALGSLSFRWPTEKKLKSRAQLTEFVEKFGVIGALMEDVKKFLDQ